MASKSASSDKFSNRAIATITLSAANTLTFSQIQFGIGLFQGIALILHRLEIYPARASMVEFTGAGDSLVFGLVTSTRITALTAADPSVLALQEKAVMGAYLGVIDSPLVADFQHLPEGGILVAANPIFLAMNTVSFVNPASATAVLRFTYKTLADADYLELLQSQMPANF